MDAKYIFVNGNSVPTLKKGLVAASLAQLLLSRGLKTTLLRLDPCLNSDFETIHSEELFVTYDGYVTDSVLGCYERFTDKKVRGNQCVTAGRIFQNVLSKERRGEYAGERVQIVSHATDEVRQCVKALGSKDECDFVVVEIGGDADNVAKTLFLEAVKQFREDGECVVISIVADEASEEHDIPCDVFIELGAIECATIYEMPLRLRELQVDAQVLNATGWYNAKESDMTEWESFVKQLQGLECEVSIAIVGECAEKEFACRSIKESLLIAGVHNGVAVELKLLNAENLNDGNVERALNGVGGVVIASGSGSQGLEGRVTAVRWCRENDVPMLAMGLGMHAMVIEYARNIVGLREANSTEADARTAHNVIDLMTEQKTYSGLCGAMRLGEFECRLNEGTQVAEAYETLVVNERHSHRFEFNSRYRKQLEEAGLNCVGVNPETNLVEAVEVPSHRLMIGVQFQPEYGCSVMRPNRLIAYFVKNVIKK